MKTFAVNRKSGVTQTDVIAAMFRSNTASALQGVYELTPQPPGGGAGSCSALPAGLQ